MSGILLASGATDIKIGGYTWTATDFEISPTDSTAWLQFRTDGKVYDQDNTYKGVWINPPEAADTNWYIRANSATPDTPDSGTMDTWLQLNASRTWSMTEPGFGTDSATFTVDFKYGSGGSVVGSGTCSITAQVDF